LILKEKLNVKVEKEAIEGTVNYIIDVLIRCGYLMDKLINALEEKHMKEGGYSENLLKKRLAYRKR
jgi:four helix bundle suffix protein